MAHAPSTCLRFMLTTLAFALTLGGLELVSAVGLFDFRTVLTVAGPDPRKSPDNTLDPELIHIHKPYLRRVGATRGDIALAFHLAGTPLHPYNVAYDRAGFRNPCDLSAAEVVVLGDSFVEGGLVAADDLMTATLARLLGCTVANLGQSSYGPQQELAVLKRFRHVAAPQALHLGVLRRERSRRRRALRAAQAGKHPLGGSLDAPGGARLAGTHSRSSRQDSPPSSLPTRQTGRRGGPCRMTTAG